MEDFGYIYDSSIGIPPSRVPIWPYTLDYKIPHECKSGTCPTKSFPGKCHVLWTACASWGIFGRLSDPGFDFRRQASGKCH